MSLWRLDLAVFTLYSITHLTRYIEPLLGQCWSDVVSDGSTLNQHWFKVSSLLGRVAECYCRPIMHKAPLPISVIEGNENEMKRALGHLCAHIG